MSRRIVVNGAIAFFLFVLSAANAAAETWQAVSGSYGDNGKVIPLFGGYSFHDGEFTDRTPITDSRPGAIPAYSSYGFVLLDRPRASQFEASVGLVFEKTGDDARPPLVDMVNKTIDVSSLVLKGLAKDPNAPRHDVFRPVGIGLAGTFAPVPFVDNGDGTFTAKWATPAVRGLSPFYGSNQPVSITFAAVGAVPEPTAFWLLMSGLGANGLMLWALSRKARRRVPRIQTALDLRPAWRTVFVGWFRNVARGASLPSPFPQHHTALVDTRSRRDTR